MQDTVRFMFLAAFLLLGVMAREADAQNRPDPATAMCAQGDLACESSRERNSRPRFVVTYDQGPKRSGEEPARFRSRRDFALGFGVFRNESKISPRLAGEILRALYDYQQKQMPLLKSLRNELADDALYFSLCRQNRSPDRLSRQHYATLEERLRWMLTWEQWNLWEEWCSDCAYLVAGWSYDKPILTRRNVRR